jgi:hypothetical protein
MPIQVALSIAAIGAVVVLGTQATAAAAARPARVRGAMEVQVEIVERELTTEEATRRIWWPGSEAHLLSTSEHEREVLRQLIPDLVALAQSPEGAPRARLEALASRASAIELRLERWRVDGERFVALLEAPERRRGFGAYLFHVAPPRGGRPELLLQAPHVYHDLATEVIAATLFFRRHPGPWPRALFTNTIHRYASDSGQRIKRKDAPADVCHNPQHAFQAATAAVATTLRPLVVLQLHGFANVTVDDESGGSIPSGTAAVVSSGDRKGSSPRVAALARALSVQLKGVVRFPEQVGALGATTNVQGAMLTEHRGAEFIHIELSAELRQRLRLERELGDWFDRTLLSVALEAAQPR